MTAATLAKRLDRVQIVVVQRRTERPCRETADYRQSLILLTPHQRERLADLRERLVWTPGQRPDLSPLSDDELGFLQHIALIFVADARLSERRGGGATPTDGQRHTVWSDAEEDRLADLLERGLAPGGFDLDRLSVADVDELDALFTAVRFGRPTDLDLSTARMARPSQLNEGAS